MKLITVTLDTGALPGDEYIKACNKLEIDFKVVTVTERELKGSDIQIDLKPMRQGVVADIVYRPLETPLLAQARLQGLKAVDGLGMLLHQARPGFAAWFGVEPTVSAGLRAHLVSILEGRR